MNNDSHSETPRKISADKIEVINSNGSIAQEAKRVIGKRMVWISNGGPVAIMGALAFGVILLPLLALIAVIFFAALIFGRARIIRR